MVEVADDGRNDSMETKYGMKVDREAVERSKLRTETRKSLMAKSQPKKYDEKIETTLKTFAFPFCGCVRFPGTRWRG
jgi:hypothetical protein